MPTIEKREADELRRNTWPRRGGQLGDGPGRPGRTRTDSMAPGDVGALPEDARRRAARMPTPASPCRRSAPSRTSCSSNCSANSSAAEGEQRPAPRAAAAGTAGRSCAATNGRMTFSVNSEVGASSAPLAVDRIAESSAPKNSTCAHSGVRSRIRSGRMRWISRASSAAKQLGRSPGRSPAPT